jgi:CRP/FNR family transcriptional regulator, cyclic AMP receptor protein
MTGNPTIIGAEPLLRGLPADQIALLTAATRRVNLPLHHRLFEEGGPADRFWIIDAGQVALDVLHPGVGRLTIAILGRGDVVGLSWLVPPYQWQFGAVCMQPVQAFEFDARAVRAACAEHPELGHAIAMRFMTIAIRRLQTTRTRLLRARSVTPAAGDARRD